MEKPNTQKEKICHICKRKKQPLISADAIKDSINQLIKNTHSGWDNDKYICEDDLNQYRLKFVGQALADEAGEISKIHQDIVESIIEQENITKNTAQTWNTNLSIWDKTADKIAEFGGSWTFIISFFSVLFVWIFINSLTLLYRPFDPYPFILLNLILSCLAAIQAPIIMMSQNRMESRDRMRAENDYQVNLKAEIEIRSLHEKIDHLMINQWQKMMEAQEIQLEILKELNSKKK